MKRLLLFSLSLLMILLSCLPVSAHSGKTDASGGHYDSSTGEYHYHHGYPAHSHKNGCPYGYDDKTGSNSGNSSIGSSKGLSISEGGVFGILLLFGFIAAFVVVIFMIVNSSSTNYRTHSQKPHKPSSHSSSSHLSPSAAKSPTTTQKPPTTTPKQNSSVLKPSPQKHTAPSSPNIDQLKSENKRLLVKNSQLAESVRSYQNQLKEKDQIISRLRATDDKKKIQELESKIKTLTDERDKYKKQAEDSSKPVAPPSDTTEVLQLKTRIKDLQDQNKRLQDQNKQLREQNEKQAAQISALGQAAQPEPKYSDDYVLGLEKKISTLEAINDTHKKTINSLKLELTNARKSSHSSAPIYNEEREFLEGKIDSLKEELKEPTYFKNLFTSMLRRMEKEGDSLFYNYPSVHLFLRQVTDKRFHRAMIEDMSISGKINVQASILSSSNTYTTTLQSCGCEDFRRTNAPCKHMMFLAYHTGVLLIHKDEAEKGMKKYLDALRSTKVPKK